MKSNITDKELHNIMNTILKELEELKSMYEKWDNDKDSFTSMDGVYKHKASGIDDSINIMKKYYSDN